MSADLSTLAPPRVAADLVRVPIERVEALIRAGAGRVVRIAKRPYVNLAEVEAAVESERGQP